MVDHVTHEELDDAIQAVHERIDETEATLRREFGHAAQHLEQHLSDQDKRFDKQDDRLNQIMLAVIGGLFIIVGSLLALH